MGAFYVAPPPIFPFDYFRRGEPSESLASMLTTPRPLPAQPLMGAFYVAPPPIFPFDYFRRGEP